MDNIDKKVDTPAGKDSYHGIASECTKRLEKEMEQQTLCWYFELTKQKLPEVPESVIKLLSCKITGCPKPQTSPQYEQYVPGSHMEEFESAELSDIIWLMLRFLKREDSRFYYQPEVIASDSNRSTTYMQSTISSDDSASPIFDQSGKLADVNIESEIKSIDDSLCPEKTTEVVIGDQEFTDIWLTEQGIKQCIPVWSAYNSHLGTPTSPDPEVDIRHMIWLVGSFLS